MVIPNVARRWWWVFFEPFLYDIVILIGAGLGGTATVAKFVNSGDSLSATLTGIGAALIFGCGLARALLLRRQQKARESPHDLASSLHALHAILLLGVEDPKSPRLRVTIHSKEGQFLHQVLDYVGDDRAGKTAGRVFPIQSGIIGRAGRKGEAFVASRKSQNYEQYVQELVNEWAYTEEDARKRDRDTMAWLAIPLKDKDDKVVGVVYADSVEPDFFSDVRFWLANCACVGIATYVGQRYT